jgi:hypothetical protein
VAIKGRTKRSQGRPARRATPGPRPVAVERPAPWYKAPAFAVTCALVVLLLTGYLAVERLQYGWARDDVARFTSDIAPPVERLAAIASDGVDDTPGLAGARELETAELTEQAELWQIQVQEASQELFTVSLGDSAVGDGGVPSNSVGGRVEGLSEVLAAYAQGAILYEEAAATWGLAAQAPEPPAEEEGEEAETPEDEPTAPDDLQGQLMDRADQLAVAAQDSLDNAAAALARLRADYDLSLSDQLPGESSAAYSERGA